MNLSSLILKAFGWKVTITVPNAPKCIICVAPHTSNWDFVMCKLAYAAVGRHAGFLMKSQWFFWPLGYFFRAVGGIPVERRNKTVSLTDVVVKKFQEAGQLHLAITPEGTRGLTTRWHTGFLHIALRAGIPIQLGVLDYGNKLIRIEDIFLPTGDIEADLMAVKRFYAPFTNAAKYPDKFSAE